MESRRYPERFLENSEEEGNNIMAKKLEERFGGEIREIPGFLEFLLGQKDQIEWIDVKVNPHTGAKIACYLIDKHWGSPASGIGMASIIGIYGNGKNLSRSFVYKDQYEERKNDLSLDFCKVEIIDIGTSAVTIKAIPARSEYAPSKFTLEL